MHACSKKKLNEREREREGLIFSLSVNLAKKSGSNWFSDTVVSSTIKHFIIPEGVFFSEGM